MARNVRMEDWKGTFLNPYFIQNSVFIMLDLCIVYLHIKAWITKLSITRFTKTLVLVKSKV